MYSRAVRNLLILVFVFLYLPFFYQYLYRDQPYIDLPSFYWGANVVFNNHGSPYRPGVFDDAQRIMNQKIFPYLYPPPSLLLFYPFSLMSYNTAKILMVIINHISIILLIYLLIFKILKKSIVEVDYNVHLNGFLLPALILYIVKFSPITHTLDLGQINIIAMDLLCLTWYLLKKDELPVVASTALFGAILLKTYPVLLIPLLLIKRKFKIILWISFFVIIFSIASYAILPRSTWTDWTSIVLSRGGYAETPIGLFSPSSPHNQSINGFTSRLFLIRESAILPNPLAAKVAPYLLSICVVTVQLLLAWMLWIYHKDKFIDFEFALFLLTMYLVAPFSWDHHLVFIIPAALLAILSLLSSRHSLLKLFSVGLCIFLVAWPIPVYSSLLQHGLLQLGASTKLYAVFGLWTFFVITLTRYLRYGVRARHNLTLEVATHHPKGSMDSV
jgi:alpha-1,2-mannosyltransferase